MSETLSKRRASEVGERLKTATEIDPAKLPRLQTIAEETAEGFTLALNGLSLDKVLVTFSGFEFASEPAGGAKEEGGNLVAELTSKRFARVSYVSAPKALANACISAFFGASPPPRQDARELTDLDRALVKTTLKCLVESFRAAFEPIDDGRFELGGFVASEAFEDVFGGLKADRNLVMMFEMELVGPDATAQAKAKRGPGKEGAANLMLSLAVPVPYLAVYRRKLSQPTPTPEPSPDESWSEAMIRNFSKSGLHLEAVLARKQMPLSGIAHFRVGQTLALDVGVNELVTLECEGKPIFKSQIGFSRGSYVARFEESIDPTQEFINDILSD